MFLLVAVKVILVSEFAFPIAASLVTDTLRHPGGPLQVEREDKRYEIIGIVSWGNG